MRKQGTFLVLNQFQDAVQNCRATLAGKVGIEFRDGLSKAVEILEDVRALGGKVALIGNGGSAAIASHQAVDLWRNAGLKAIAFNDPSSLTCIANDFGYADVFSRPIEMFCERRDAVIAISSSGNSANILKGVEKAKAIGCQVIAFSGFRPENFLNALGDVNFYIPSHSYGVVEAAHLLLLHAIVDEYASGRQTLENHDTRTEKSAAFQHAAHSAD